MPKNTCEDRQRLTLEKVFVPRLHQTSNTVRLKKKLSQLVKPVWPLCQKLYRSLLPAGRKKKQRHDRDEPCSHNLLRLLLHSLVRFCSALVFGGGGEHWVVVMALVSSSLHSRLSAAALLRSFFATTATFFSFSSQAFTTQYSFRLKLGQWEPQKP